jgi:hypothetical protein
VAKKKLRKKPAPPQRSVDEQHRADVRRRLKREHRAEREIHALIAKLMRLSYQRQQKLLQLASAIVGKDFVIVPAKSQQAREATDHEPAVV